MKMKELRKLIKENILLQSKINTNQCTVNDNFIDIVNKMQELVSKDIVVLHKRIDMLERIIVKHDGVPPEHEILIKDNDFTMYEHRNQWMPFWKLKKCFKRWKKREDE